jgi:thiamine monophosphate synthase
VRGADEAAQVEAAGGLDYLLFGTVYATSSKPGVRPSGPAGLAEVVRATSLPVLAVGGVTPENTGEVARTGAAGFAGIGLFMDWGPDQMAASSQAWQRAARAFAEVPHGGGVD